MLRQDDLIFCKTESGVTSCGYNISNMLLKNTLNSQHGHDMKGKSKDDIRIAKLMEDLVVPSGLYYCHPMTKHKVFNYKPVQPHSQREKGEKGEKGEKDEIDITNGMLDESTYDKLLSLVSMDKKKLFDKKTRKNKGAIFQKVKEGSMGTITMGSTGSDLGLDIELPKGEKGEKGEKPQKRKSIKINTQKLLEKREGKQKPNQRKTKKVRFADF
jgi:hypothetical protein